MLAVLREDFTTADLLKDSGLCDPEYKNSEGKAINKLCTEYKLPGPCDYLKILCPFVPQQVRISDKPDTLKLG